MNKTTDRLMLVVNPVSGNGKALDMLPEIDSIITKLGTPFDVRITEKQGQATDMSAQAARVGYGRVIAVGGDGTVNEVAAGLLNKETALGVIPAGNRNDFFKSLSVKGDINQICNAAVSGPVKLFDVGILGNQVFISSVGVGFDTLFSGETDLTRIGGYSYYKAIYRAYKTYSAYDIDLRIDNLELKQSISMITANIGRNAGAGLRAAPAAISNDGKFDVCLVLKVKRSRLFALLPKIVKGEHTRLPEVRMYRCRQLEISSELPLPVHFDGETYDSSNGHITIKAHSGKLKAATGFNEKKRS
jgi:diacylglycerol kinase (ATP)